MGHDFLLGFGFLLGLASFDRIYQNLAEKYSLVRKDVPFVGDKYVRFEQGDTIIEIDAPHMSFDMAVIYMTADFKKQSEKTSHEEEMQKQKREAGQF